MAVHNLGEFGARLPLASEDNLAAYTGALSDYAERFEAFLPDVASLVLAGYYKYRSLGGVGLRGRLAPLFWIDTGDAFFDDFELWLLYSFLAWYDHDKIGAGGGLSGRLLATESDLDIGERTLHQLGFFVNLKLGRWMPDALRMRPSSST